MKRVTAGRVLATWTLVAGVAGAAIAVPAGFAQGAAAASASPQPAATSQTPATASMAAAAASARRADPQQLALGDPARKGRQAPVCLDGITDTASGDVIAANELAQRLADARVLFIGEEHTNGEFHRAQLRVIEALHAAGRKVIVGLEMFPWTTTTPLERWSRGEFTEQQFLDEARWYETWSHHWGGYRDIFAFARDKRLRMVGINAPRDVVRNVRAKGLDSLDAGTRKRMPPAIDLSSAEHRALVTSYFDAEDPLHSKMSPEQAEGLYQAQVTWDAAMGWNAGQALSTPVDPKEIVVVLIGSGHVAYGLGAERQLAPHFKGRIASLIPVTVRDGEGKSVAGVNAAYANYLWGVPWTAQPTEPVLGVSLMGSIAKEPSKVIQVDAGSTADQSGIKVGDILRELDGTKIDGGTALQRKTGDYRWGDAAKLVIERGGQLQTLDIVFRRKG
jgi:uncharacterized iron-regulated protein